MPTSLVTFLFGNKKVTSIDGGEFKIYAKKDSASSKNVYPTVLNFKGNGEETITLKNIHIDGSNLGERGEAIILSSPNLNVNICVI